jgi:pimeloyl-ACP methyl ester carboxylesterase
MWFAWHLAHGRPGWALAGLVLALGGHALVLGLESVLMWAVNRRDPLPAPTAAEVLRAWWGEVRSAPRVFCWEQPFRSRTHPDRPTGRPGQRGLLLVHGFVCNRGLWNTWLPRLASAGIPFVAVDLEPVFGDIDDYGDILDQALETLRRNTGLAPVVVAHSMGGLAVRAWLRRRGAAAVGDVHHVVTVGTPHFGTALARFGVSPNTRQMLKDSAWVAALGQAESTAMRERFTCVYSNCDNIVFPTSTAVLPGAGRRGLRACAHVHMVFHPEVFEVVMSRLADPATSPST